MKKLGKPAGGPGSRLSDDDHDLWKGMAATLEPLKKAKARVHPQVPSASRPEHVANADKHSARALRPDAQSLAPPPASQSKPPPPLGDFDRRKARKLGTGRVEIDARIDLHGMRQSEAHAALCRFLFACYDRGARLVLVITGKGAPAEQRESWSETSGARGVIRRSVPMWLAEPELRPIVVSFSGAAIRHGGDGALYVHLRNKDKGAAPR